MAKNKHGYVSLFSSAGVGCYGFSLEGFDCIVTSELIQRRLDVQKANRVASLHNGYVSGDFTLQSTKDRVYDAIREWRDTYKQDDIDIVIATPPCQGISVANHKKNDEIKRNSLVVESLTLINKILPKFFVLENVRSFLTTLCTDVDGKDKAIEEAIYVNLAGNYNLAHRIINFKDYGSNSSRTRTIVIGVRKDIENVTPYDLFPSESNAPTLRELIGDLKPLKQMGKTDKADIYHGFKKYDRKMLDWIKDIKEGQSAFDNKDIAKRPHKIVNGLIVVNANKNGDKYSRCFWDKVAPCVHTRNDILASQSTVHPVDNRVFSIRELMRFMTVPESFRWTEHDINELNALNDEDRDSYLKKHEINIRQSLGEAVPTVIFQNIAKKIKECMAVTTPSLSQIKRLIDRDNLKSTENITAFIDSSALDFASLAKIAELANSKRLDDGAFYTRQDLCFNLVSSLPDYKGKRTIKILEPSVGVGNFLPSLFHKYRHIPKVKLDVLDINEDSIKILKKLLRVLKVPSNFDIRFVNDDFLTHEFRNKYEVIVGNPPFGRIKAEKLAYYKRLGLGSNIKSRNLFALFIEKSLSLADHVALFSPKSLLNAPEFVGLRSLLALRSIRKINDYGEKGFPGVKIETISIHVDNNAEKDKTVIDSLILRSFKTLSQDYIIDNTYPTWIIYRNNFFDKIAADLDLNIFEVLRDRSMTSKNMKPSGKVRVIKSRNITSDGVIGLGTDMFVDSAKDSPISSQYASKESVIAAPNLSYYPRAAILPKGTVVDGSAAILVPKTDNRNFTQDNLKFFASKEFFLFYRIARNYATRSLNIDRNSVYFWGLPKSTKTDLYTNFKPEEVKSIYLFADAKDLFELGRVTI